MTTPQPQINPAAPAPDSLLTTVAEGPPKCGTCGAKATHAVVWPWGEHLLACPTHAMLAQQTAENLQRSVLVTALPAPQNEPLTRTERVALKAEVYALEAEAEDLKARGLALYDENTRLTTQVLALQVRSKETAAQLVDARQLVEQLQDALQSSEAQRGELADEVSRLTSLVRFQPAEPTDDTQPSHRGLESDSRVE